MCTTCMAYNWKNAIKCSIWLLKCLDCAIIKLIWAMLILYSRLIFKMEKGGQMFFYVLFCILAAVGIILVMYGTYEEFYMHKKKLLILGSAITSASLIYFVINSYKKGIDREFFGELIMLIFFIFLLVIAVFKKEE